MAAKTKDRVVDIAGSAKPYVDRALHDDELRDHVREAYTAARAIYDQLVAPRGVTGLAVKVAGDEDIQANLRRTMGELRQAAERLQGRQERKSHGATLMIMALVLAVLFNPLTGADTRRWLKNKLFGGGDDFGYQPGSGNGSGGS
jgi:hypothetical protein